MIFNSTNKTGNFTAYGDEDKCRSVTKQDSFGRMELDRNLENVQKQKTPCAGKQT